MSLECLFPRTKYIKHGILFAHQTGSKLRWMLRKGRKKLTYYPSVRLDTGRRTSGGSNA